MLRFVVVAGVCASFAFGAAVAAGGDGDMKDAEPSRSRHPTWHAETEAIMNDHIALEMAAALQYRAMYAFCNRDHVNLKKSAKLFAENANEEFKHAYELMEYQIKRGGVVDIKALDSPVHEFSATPTKSDARVAFESALALEKRVYDSLIVVHKTCGKHEDAACQHMIENYLEEQIEAIDSFARHVADLDRVGVSGHAVWEFDREL